MRSTQLSLPQSLPQPLPQSLPQSRRLKRLMHIALAALVGLSLTLLTTACTTATTSQYEATALTTYTWQVDYATTVGGGGERPPRIEEFESTSLLNRNGQPPDEAATGPDDQGLWWADLPPRPTLEEMEARLQPSERFGTPRLNKRVDYSLTFDKEGQTVTLPTNYSVYRQVARLYPNQPPLELTLGVNDSSVEKVEPQ